MLNHGTDELGRSQPAHELAIPVAALSREHDCLRPAQFVGRGRQGEQPARRPAPSGPQVHYDDVRAEGGFRGIGNRSGIAV
jgi:hypothetical protein